MKIPKSFWLLAVLAAIVGLALFHRLRNQPKSQSETETNTPAVAAVPVASANANRNTAQLATNANGNPAKTTAEATAIAKKYHQGLISKEQAMQALSLLANKKPQNFYGKVIDQDGNPLAGVSVVGKLVLNDGTYGGVKTQEYDTTTDSDGLFEFTGLHGAGLGITISKPGYENGWKNDAYQSPSGGQSSPADRVIYRMWSTNVHEQLITGDKSFEVVPDGRPYFINLTDGTISEHEGGDLKVWIEYTNQPVRGQLYDWSAGIEVINGGLWEVPQAAMNSGFSDKPSIPMYEAPADGYVSSFSLKEQIKGGQRGEIGSRYFYLLLNNGKEYGRMNINLFAPHGHLHPGLIRISYAINPSGSRILR